MLCKQQNLYYIWIGYFGTAKQPIDFFFFMLAGPDEHIDIEYIIQYWVESSDEDFNTMLKLYDAKSYNWSLFMGHLVLEKLLKAVYVRNNGKHAPYIHNLYRLAEMNGFEISNENADWLDRITSFNINARYDDVKREFYKLCTREFTNEWLEKIKFLRLWIKQQL